MSQPQQTLREALSRTPAIVDREARLCQQIELEQLYNKNQLISRIRREFIECTSVSFVNELVRRAIPIDFGIDVLTQMALHKRTTMSTLVGILRHHFGESPNASQITADMLMKCVVSDFLDWDPVTSQFIVAFTLSDDVQEELDRFQYPLPMVIEPRQVRSNKETGYVLGGGSLLLRKNHHDDDICLDHINRVNSIRFTVDMDTVRMVANKWRNLDKPKEGETKADFDKRRKAFEKYDRTARHVIHEVMSRSSEFYLTHKYDKRGRVYCQGYHINYQGAPWNKAVIQLADKELVN